MPKIRTHSGAKKRFRKTAGGKWKHARAGRRHLLTPMNRKRGRYLRRADTLTRTEGRTLDKFLPYH